MKDFSKVICGPFGSSIKVKDYRSSGVPLVRIANINKNQELSQENTIFISDDLARKLKSYKVKKGDLIISQRGTLGLTVKISDSFDGGVISANFIAIKDLKGISPDYLKIFIASQFGQMQLIRRTSGQVQTKITTEDIKSLIIPIPDLETQNRIVQIMDNAYNLKKSKETEAQRLLDSINDYVLSELGIKLPELKDQMTFVVYADDVKGKRIDPYYHQSKFKRLYDSIKKYPNVSRLKDIVKILDYGLMPTQDYASNESEGIPMIRVTNIKSDGTIDMSDVKYIPFNTPKLNLKRVKQNDILMVQCGSTTGKVAIVPKKYENYTFGSFSFLIRGKEKIVNQYYLFVILRSILVQEQIKHTWNIVTVRPNTSKPNVENLKIPLPPLAVQNKIAEEVKRRMQKAETLQKEAKEILEKAKKEVENIILNGESNEN